MQNTEPRNVVSCVRVVFDMFHESLVRGIGYFITVGSGSRSSADRVAVGWSVPVVRGVAECVYLEFADFICRYTRVEPVENHSAFDGALTMKDQNDFVHITVGENLCECRVRLSDVKGCVIEVALNDAF